MRVTPTFVNLECSVRGCGARFSIPVVYRLEPLEVDAGTFDDPTRVFISTRVVVDIDATLDLEAPLRVHLDEHACNTENAALVWTPGDPVGTRSTLGVLDPSIGTPRSPYTVASDS